jgi:hypothetical protein
VVEEQFLSSASDESKTFVRNKLLDRTLWHCMPPENEKTKTYTQDRGNGAQTAPN